MKALRILFSIIGPLADIFGILSFFGFSIRNMNIDNISWKIYPILIFSLFILFRIILLKLGEIFEKYQDEKVKQDLEKVSSQKNIGKIKLAIPTTTTIIRLYEKLKKRIYEWSEDAQIKDVTLYIEFKENSWRKPHIQVFAFSEWKNEMGCFYDGDMKTESFEEGNQFFLRKSFDENYLFFYTNPNWQIQVEKAYNSISNKLINQCEIAIDTKSIRIYFLQGKVKRKIEYKLTNNFREIVKI